MEKKDLDSREEMFKKYSVKYADDSFENKEMCERRQRILFFGLCKKGMNQTNAEGLMQITLHEYDSEVARKQEIEIKAGYIFAFVSVLLAALVSNNNVNVITTFTITDLTSIVKIISEICLIISLAFIIYFVYAVFQIKDYKVFILGEDNYKAAVADKEISFVRNVETMTNITNINRSLNNKKADAFKWLLKCTFAYTVFLILFIIISKVA